MKNIGIRNTECTIKLLNPTNKSLKKVSVIMSRSTQNKGILNLMLTWILSFVGVGQKGK